MPFQPSNSTKKDEMLTYQKLGLSRKLKTRRGRDSAEKSGVHMVIGWNLDRPHLQVLKQRYHAVRLEVSKAFLTKARTAEINLVPEKLLQHLHYRIEQETYDRLAREQSQSVRLNATFTRIHGRKPTSQENRQYAESGKDLEPETPVAFPARHHMLDQLISRLENRQTHNATRYQTAWAETVGGEAAQQSQLHHIDPAGVAYFQCFNSTLSYQLQQQPEVAKRLAKNLGVPVRQIRRLQ